MQQYACITEKQGCFSFTTKVSFAKHNLQEMSLRHVLYLTNWHKYAFKEVHKTS